MTDSITPDDQSDTDQNRSDGEHRADRPPTAEEEAAAPTEVDPKTRDAFSEMAEKGANAKGEGRIP